MTRAKSFGSGCQALRRPATALASSHRRAFSLIEVLLAIFILGVGVISIAALFPAGIAQQRLSVDDSLGHTVAENALTTLRSKLKPDDFGYDPSSPTVPGDFFWKRPAFYFGATPAECGINIFQDVGTVLNEVLHNTVKYPGGPPDIRFTQGERYYPMAALKVPSDPSQGFASDQAAKPQFVWDRMFRRFQGKILVAIFVYRVNVPGGGATSYGVAANPSNPSAPPIPIWLDSTTLAPWNADDGSGPLVNCGSADAPIVIANGLGSAPGSDAAAWQEPRQWILDQNNNVYRVRGAYYTDDNPANALNIELMRPVASMLAVPVFDLGTPPNSTVGVVKNIWFMPLKDANGVSITPVYATVKEL